MAARPGHATPELAVPRGAALGERSGLEDARLQIVAGLHQRHHPHLARGAQARERAPAAGAALRVAPHGGVRHLVELVVELVDEVGVELLAVHGFGVVWLVRRSA
jgi:hypothetical protein